MKGLGWPTSCGQRRPRILLAEADWILRLGIADALRARGYDVEEADSGEELVSLALGSTLPLQLVIAAVSLPDVSGLWAMAALRREGCCVPAVMITRFHDDAIADAAYGLGALSFDLPFSPKELASYVRCLLPLPEEIQTDEPALVGSGGWR